MKSATLSIVFSIYNEEKRLPEVLQAATWADEIIVIDNTSTDTSVTLAKKYTSLVYTEPNNSMLNINKNIGIKKATKDWVLYLDGDEVITPSLKKEIQEVINQATDIVGYWMPRKNIIFGKWIQHGLWWPDKQLRLFQNGKGLYPCKHIHEYIQVEGKVGNIIEPYTHYNYDSVSQYLKKLDTIYTENEVSNLLASGYQISWTDAIRFPVSDFLKIYFAQSGYLDGLHGLVLSLLQAFYSFIVFVKLWEKQGFPDKTITTKAVETEMKHAWHDIAYWQLSIKILQTENILSRYWFKFLRRIS